MHYYADEKKKCKGVGTWSNPLNVRQVFEKAKRGDRIDFNSQESYKGISQIKEN